jgi:hypothetical protein
MIEVFIKRSELMPMDETTEQHLERRTSENEIVEADRASPSGLFKGCFNKTPLARIQFNEEDHIYRCSRCSHEYVRGELCENCGLDFEGDEEDIDIDNFSDVDDADSFDDDIQDMLAEAEDMPSIRDFYPAGPEFWLGGGSHIRAPPPYLPPWANNLPEDGIYSPRERFVDLDNSASSEDEDDSESMRDFIEDGGGAYESSSSSRGTRSASHISLSSRNREETGTDDGTDDDESDEGGVVSNGRRTHRHIVYESESDVTVTNSATTSEAGDLDEASRRLQESGWSPLQEDPHNDYGTDRLLASDTHSENSDNNTTVGYQTSMDDQDSDEDDDHRHRNFTATPSPTRLASRSLPQHGSRGHSRESPRDADQSDNDSYDSDAQGSSVTDHEGDVEMSVSPVSHSSNNTSDSEGGGAVTESLGSANTMHDIEDDSSDGTPQPANRRRRQLRVSRHSPPAEYDPRISMMFARHQLDMQDVTARQSPYFEPAARSRTSSSYRHISPRGSPSSFNISSTSPVILTSVSNRSNRIQRQYHRR